MLVQLTDAQIDESLEKVRPGLLKYLAIQGRLHRCDVRADEDFRRRFNGFYRVRRGPAWQNGFYEVLERAKSRPPSFREVLADLHRAGGRWEASFASKLLATVDPTQPVIDSVVLRNVGLRLPSQRQADRAQRIDAVHRGLAAAFAEFLPTDAGRRLVQRFRDRFPDALVTEVKMLDLVLWQARGEQETAELAG